MSRRTRAPRGEAAPAKPGARDAATINSIKFSELTVGLEVEGDKFPGVAKIKSIGRLRSPGAVPHYERATGGGADADPNATRVACAVSELAALKFDGRLHAGGRATHHGLVQGDASVRRQW